MWERKDADNERDHGSAHNDAPRTAAAPSFQSRGNTSHANIGQSLFIKGDVTGSEDLTVEGRVEGRIDLKDHNLTIGPNGRVTAEVHAKNITIVGEITGNVAADERVELTDTARLVGDIRAPRISVSDGAKFKGSVDMVQDKNEERSMDKHKEKIPAAAVQVAHAGKSIQ